MAITEDHEKLDESIAQLGRVLDEWHQTVLEQDEQAFRRCRSEYRRLRQTIDELSDRILTNPI